MFCVSCEVRNWGEALALALFEGIDHKLHVQEDNNHTFGRVTSDLAV